MLPRQVSNATELNNLKGYQEQQSALVSAEVFDAVIGGLTAFRNAELKGLEERKAGLANAADLLSMSTQSMKKIAKDIPEEEAAKAISFTDVSPMDKAAFDTWATLIGSKEQPATVRQLYSFGADSTEFLANKMKELSQRNDDRAFREFLDVTYPYLRAGAVASEVFRSSQ